MKYFDAQHNRLVFIEEEASPSYWDSQWDVKNFEKTVKDGLRNTRIINTTRKFLRPKRSTRILEGGCGNGQFVYAFHELGYDSYGVDYAPRTIARIQEHFPYLKVSSGDVRSLSFPDAYFNGYWSIGVIEHFFEGYTPIVTEMKRVLKPGGFLFLTFPHLSRLRKLKIKLGLYPLFHPEKTDTTNFYQFALDHEKLIAELRKHHFRLVQKTPYAGMKGFKDEVTFLRPILQKIYDSENIILKILTYGISVLLSVFSSHSILLVFQNSEGLALALPDTTRSAWERPPRTEI